MAECGGLLSCGIASQRSYGATCNQTFMLADIDSKVITHKVMPSDTLQGLAIKYSISVEKLKRVNKLWSNDSIHIKETLLVPCSVVNDSRCDSPEITAEVVEVKPAESNKVFTSESKQQKKDITNKSDGYKSLNDMLSKIDGQIKTHKKVEELGSDSYKIFTEMLSKIDGQIETHKSKAPATNSDNIPNVGYDSRQNLSGHLSPVKQHPFLEEGT